MPVGPGPPSRPDERLEQLVHPNLRYERTSVGDRQAACWGHGHHDPPAGPVVPHGVGHEVHGQLPEQGRVPGDHGRTTAQPYGHLQDRGLGGGRGDRGARVVRQVRGRRRADAVVGLGEVEEGGNKALR